MRRYERDKWSVVRVNAKNTTDADAEATVAVYLEGDTRTQFARNIWLPAHSSRYTWLPILTPSNIPPDKSVMTASSMQIVETDTGPVIEQRDGDTLVSETLLSVDSEQPHVVMISTNETPTTTDVDKRRDDEAYKTILEIGDRNDESGNRVLNLTSTFLPPYPEAYDAQDLLVICSDQIANDSAGLSAMRTWIARGGRAWIMLDMTGMEVTRALLGNAVTFDIVDRVQLNEFSIETPNSVSVGTDPIETWFSEEPVELTRVVAESVNVHSSIDGWPASFELPFGDGRVIVTTLGATGWRFQHDIFAEASSSGRPTSGPTGAMRYLASQLDINSGNSPALSEDLKSVLSSQLGYRVPSRGIAGLILGCNCLLIVVAGIWLARREQLERIALFVPVATIVSGAGLIAIGSANTSSIPATSATLRLANVSSETNTVHTETLAAFYSPDTSGLPLKVDLAGVVTPDVSDLTGVSKRAVWDDDGNVLWERIDVSSGSVRFAQARENLLLIHPLRARATFGPNGLEGRIVGIGQVGAASDALVASPPAPHSTAKINHSGSFAIGIGDTLSKNEFLGGTMLSDEQQRRQTIYRSIFTPRQGGVYPQRPTLFVWGDSRSFGLATSDHFQDAGATLFAIPLDIGRTLPKQSFTIPSTFIRIGNRASNLGASAFFNPRTGQWMKNVTSPTKSFFQFILPRSVLPCQVKSADITLKIHAPSRTVEIAGLKGDTPFVIETLESPSGVLTLRIEDPELLHLDTDGAVRFGVTVSRTQAQIEHTAQLDQPRVPGESDKDDSNFDNSTWQIDYLRLSVNGETL